MIKICPLLKTKVQNLTVPNIIGKIVLPVAEEKKKQKNVSN